MKKIRDLEHQEDAFMRDSRGFTRTFYISRVTQIFHLCNGKYTIDDERFIFKGKEYPLDQVNLDLMVYTKDEVEVVNGKYRIKEGV